MIKKWNNKSKIQVDVNVWKHALASIKYVRKGDRAQKMPPRLPITSTRVARWAKLKPITEKQSKTVAKERKKSKKKEEKKRKKSGARTTKEKNTKIEHKYHANETPGVHRLILVCGKKEKSQVVKKRNRRKINVEKVCKPQRKHHP